MTDFSMLDKDHPERFHPTETDLDEARERLRKWRSGNEHEVTIISSEGVGHGVVEGNTIRVTHMLPEGEGFCSRCQLPLSQCCCKERGV